MSYILEALKKAQAERQLGNAPDIHTQAPVLTAIPAQGAQRKPLLLGLGAGVVLTGVVAAFAWRGQAPQAPAEPAVLAQAGKPAAAPARDPAPVAGAPVASPATAPVSAPVAAPAEAVAAPVVAVAAVPPAPPVAAPSKAAAAAAPPAPQPTVPVPQPVTPPLRSVGAQAATPVSAPVRDSVPEAVYLPAPAAEAPVVRAPEPPIEENLRTLQQLPEAIQREVPKVSFGGYIYSPNPAERLLLVDKVLRREGEELAPGLVLERLMPKYAVMNFRGTRYRVGY